MNIKDIILDANLCNEADKEITFENKRIPYAIARKKHEFTKEKIHFYAEYYFLDLDDELISILSDYKNKYREFQIKLLAPHFYKHVNDLRWNLYVIFLVEDEKELMDIDVNAIENDDNYARKFFFNREETLKFLKREDIFFTNENNINRELKLGQFQQWVEILDTVKLTGCLAESKLRNENVELYLNTGSFEDKSFIDSSPKASQSDIRNKSHVDRVMSIEMGKFREHCFKKTGVFSFGQVNLLQGPNGCGKTSVTEAIELAITNSVKRLKDMGEEPGRYEGLKVILKSGVTADA